MHGGASTGRPLVHGRYSKYLPQRLKEVYEERLKDQNLLSLQPDVALIESLMVESLKLMDGPSSAEWWQKAIAIFADVKTAISKKNSEALLKGITELGRVFDNGLGAQQQEQKVLGLMEQKRKVSESEVKRLTAIQSAISVRELMVLLALIIDLVNKHVPDPQQRKQLGDAIARTIPSQVGG